MATVTGKQFNQQPSKVKRAAETEPVVITEHDRPSFVLMTYAEYQRLSAAPADLAAWLRMDDPNQPDIDFEVEPVGSWVDAVDL